MHINPNGIFSASLFDNSQIEQEFKPGSANNKSQENQQLKKVSDQENSPERDFLNDDEFFENYFPNSNDQYSNNNKPQENLQFKNVSYQKNSMEQLDFNDGDAFANEFFFNSEELCPVNNKPQENQQLKNESSQDNLSQLLDRFDDDEYVNEYFSNSKQYSDNDKILLNNDSNKQKICSATNYINTTDFASKEINKRENVDDLKESSNSKKQKIFNDSLKQNAIVVFSKNKNLPKKVTKSTIKTRVVKLRNTRNSNKTDLLDEKNPSKITTIISKSPIKTKVVKPRNTRNSNKNDISDGKNLSKTISTISIISKSSIEDHGEITNRGASPTNNDSLENKILEIINNPKLGQDDVIFKLFKILSPSSRRISVITRKILPYFNRWSNEITVETLRHKLDKNKKILECLKINDEIFFNKILSIFKEHNEENEISGGITEVSKVICSKINPWLLSEGEKEITVDNVIKLIKNKDELKDINEILKFSLDKYHENIVKLFNKNAKNTKSLNEAATALLDDVNEFRREENQKAIAQETLYSTIKRLAKTNPALKIRKKK